MTTYFSQRDPKWRDKLLGFGHSTFGAAGCVVTSFANFQKYQGQEDTPLDINETAKACGAFQGDMMVFSTLAKKLGYSYLKTTIKPTEVCIAETNHYSKLGVPQHFFLYKPENGKRIDPLDLTPQWEDNTYNIVSYRVLKTVETPKYKTGIDISHWQGNIDWSKIKTDFVIQKCTEGTTYLDPTYKQNKVLKPFLSYHFASGGDPIKEAEWYLKNSNGETAVLDWEIDHTDPVKWCTSFINHLKGKGITCWLYTNDARAIKYPWPKDWIFWIARYKDYTGDLDWNYAPKFKDWAVWQFTSRGKLNGIIGSVDMNVARDWVFPVQTNTAPVPTVITIVPDALQAPTSYSTPHIPIDVSTPKQPTVWQDFILDLLALIKRLFS